MDNVVACCLVCNIMKGVMTAEQFIHKCAQVTAHFNLRKDMNSRREKVLELRHNPPTPNGFAIPALPAKF